MFLTLGARLTGQKYFYLFSVFILTAKINVSSSIVTCFKCKSINYANENCEDPFDPRIRQAQHRICPQGEVCIKIVGKRTVDGQAILVRDCYKAGVLHPALNTASAGGIPLRSASLRNSSISYYDERIDGFGHICSNFMCNRTSPHSSIEIEKLIIALLASFNALTMRL